MHVTRAVTGNARRAELLRGYICRVAAVALQFGVHAAQGKLRVARMIEGDLLPTSAVMALRAVGAHATRVSILRTMTPTTVLRNRILHATGDMTAAAIGTCMCALQSKAGLLGMIELSGRPANVRMTLLAVVTARPLVHIVWRMTGHALRRRAFIAIGQVARSALQFGMLAAQHKTCLRVIELRV